MGLLRIFRNTWRGIGLGGALAGTLCIPRVSAEETNAIRDKSTREDVSSTDADSRKERKQKMTQLALARVCVSEAGLQTKTPDCAAIHQVLRRRKGQGSLLRIMRMYSTRVFDQSRSDRRRWVAWLNPRGTKPRGWPLRTMHGTPHPPWADYRDAWLRVYRHAGAILRGEVKRPCAETPDHWGGRFGIDLRRARIAGWREVDCGPTRNAFWEVPDSRSPRRPTASAAARAGARGD